VISNQQELSDYIVGFYKNLFGSFRHKGVHLADNFWLRTEQISALDQEVLDTPFTEKEVQLAIVGMKTKSAPGPNGFTVLFFKKMWDQIKGELMAMVKELNDNTSDLQRLNYGVITLVPKTLEANTIRQYRPICLLNVDFKIFPKLLTDRITPLADSIISESQSTFIKGRNILEGVVVLHEIIHEFRRSGRKGVLFKIDFKKAYDKVKWEFVEEVMERKGFSKNWIKKTLCTIQGGEYASVLMKKCLLILEPIRGLGKGTHCPQ
jgi:hypothetical protein